MEVKVITDVTTEPVSLAEIKATVRIDQDDTGQDVLLMLICKGARERLEKELNLSFATKTLMWQYDGYASEIPYGPVQSVTTLTKSTDEVAITDYHLSGLDFKSIDIKGVGDCYIFYPVGYGGLAYAYNLTYVAGYTELPSALKQSLLMQIDYEYSNQGMPDMGLSPDAVEKASGYSRNLFIQ